MGNSRSVLKTEENHYSRLPLPGIPRETLRQWPVTTCRAVLDRNATNKKELSFRKGDTFITLHTKGDWWHVRHPRTMKKGYVPCNYVEPIEWLENQPWYFGRIQRQQAETLLSMDGNLDGDFLVRKSESNPNTYSLTLLANGVPKHYRILRNNGRYHISNWRSFLTVQELIRHHQQRADGLCQILSNPCLPFVSSRAASMAHVTRSRDAEYQRCGDKEPRYSVDPTFLSRKTFCGVTA